MESWILHMVRGYLLIQIRGSSYDRFLNLCAFHNISLWNIQPYDYCYRANVAVSDLKKIDNIVKKSHAEVTIVERHGFCFILGKYKKRKACILGILIALSGIFWLSGRVWNITLDGNQKETDEIVYEYLSANKIYPGIRKSSVDCHEISEGIRSYFSDFSWVAVELHGTQLMIHVKEGILPEKTEKSGRSSSLCADRSGRVVSILVRNGTALVSEGDEVKKGDILVSEEIPLIDDDGNVYDCRYVNADADVWIEWEMNYKDIVAYHQKKKRYTGNAYRKYLVQIAENEISIPGKNIVYEESEKLMEAAQLKIMKHFYLPVYIRKYTVKEYVWDEIEYTKQDVRAVLETNFQYFIKKLGEKGVQIFENDVKIRWNEKSANLSGIIRVGQKAVRRISIKGRGKSTEEE